MEEKSINEEILEKIEKEVERIPSFYEHDSSAEFQDKHTAMQTYLMFRMLQELEGIHNGLFVFYNEKQSSKE